MKNVTIKDIAVMAGVAKSTVSRYLNGGHVSDETSQKIKKVIDEHNYEPNMFAQSLKAKKTKLIGIIAPRLDSIVTSRAIMAVDESLKEMGYNSLILNTSLKQSLEIEYLEMLPRLKVDGIILLATELSKTHEKIIKTMNVPILVMGQQCELAPSIIDDDYQAGAVMGQFVKACGHHQILYVGTKEEDVALGINRRNGVLDQFKDSTQYNVQTIKSDFTLLNAESVVFDALTHFNPSVIICATDRMAIGAMNAIERHGKKVVEDISVTGFGGYSTMRSKLTTIRFNSETMGYKAAETIINMIDGKTVDQVQMVDFTFIKGDSVKDKMRD